MMACSITRVINEYDVYHYFSFKNNVILHIYLITAMSHMLK
jgi:hypothetical protein